MGSRSILAASAVFILGLLALPALLSARPPVYEVVEIATPGPEASAPSCVGEAGHVVGWYEIREGDPPPSTPIRRAYLWRNGELTELGTLGGLNSEAHAVNGLGQVVGWAETADRKRRPFLWLPEPVYGYPAGLNQLPTPRSIPGEARDINERGEIVGFTDLSRSRLLWLPSPAYGFEAGVMELCADDYTACRWRTDHLSINDLTQVAAANDVWLPVPAYGLAAGWTELFPPANDYGLNPTELNNAGLVSACFVGFTGCSFFVYDVWTGLPLMQVWAGVAFGINDRGVAVGVTSTSRTQNAQFVETGAAGVPRAWNIDDWIVRASGWRIRWLVDINNANEVVAVGGRGDGPWRSLVLRPLNAEFYGWSPGTSFEDFKAFKECMTGPTTSLPSWDHNCDSNADGDADLADFQVLQLAFEPGAD